MTYRFTLAAAAAALVLGCAGAVASDWPQFRGPQRNGHSTEKGLLKAWPKDGPKLLWTATGLGKGYSSVSVARGRVYITGLVGTEGILSAYSLEGKRLWRVSYGPDWHTSHPGARSIPTVSDGRVYLTSGVGNAACFDAATGKQIWFVRLFDIYEAPQVQWGYAESPLLDGDKVIFTPCGRKATMVALDRRTGKQIWASKALGQGSSFCSPVMVTHGGRRMIVTLTETAVVAFSPDDGAVLWQYPYQNARRNHPVSPIYHDGLLYVTSGYGKGAICLSLGRDGKPERQLWEQQRQDPVHGQAVIVGGHVYAASHQRASGRWSCVDVRTGQVAWEDGAMGRGGSVIAADGMLYCYAENGTVGLLVPTPSRCQVVSSFALPSGDGPHWAHPAISDGRLYLRRGDALMCYDVRARK